jgi:hypothetical protein
MAITAHSCLAWVGALLWDQTDQAQLAEHLLSLSNSAVRCPHHPFPLQAPVVTGATLPMCSASSGQGVTLATCKHVLGSVS